MVYSRRSLISFLLIVFLELVREDNLLRLDSAGSFGWDFGGKIGVEQQNFDFG
jgi:hypothetical protein